MKKITSVRILIEAIRQDLARRAVERQLSKLNERTLKDIGLDYAQISSAARQAVGMSPDSPTIPQILRHLATNFWFFLSGWQRKHRLYGELAALDDRMLADIGLARHELRELVRDPDSLTARTLGTYPAAMRDYQSLPLALWGKARIVQDGMFVQRANNGNEPLSDESRVA